MATNFYQKNKSKQKVLHYPTEIRSRFYQLVGRLDVVVLNFQCLYFRHASLYAEMCEHGNGDDEVIPHILNRRF